METANRKPDQQPLQREEILRMLLAGLTVESPSRILRNGDQIINEVVFESDIDGEHYCLIRCRPHKNQSVSLSPREQAIAKLVAQGLPNKVIGIHLHISPWTVATHLRRMFTKLGVTSRTAMITRLLEENLLRESS